MAQEINEQEEMQHLIIRERTRKENYSRVGKILKRELNALDQIKDKHF